MSEIHKRGSFLDILTTPIVPMSNADTTPDASSTLASRLLTMPAAVGVLFLLAWGLVDSPCWGLFFLVALAAWPIWHYQQEYVLFQRRAVLERATREGSAIRGWLWAGRVTRSWQVLVALVWASLLLAFSVLLSIEHWLVLTADVLMLALVVGPVRRRLASQVQEQQLGVLVRRWPLFLLNLLFLTAGFLVIDFFLVGAPDTRGMTWHAVTEQTLNAFAAKANCPLSGFLVGFLAAVKQLTWHLSEVLIPNLLHSELKLAAWALILLQASVFAYAFTRYQLGVVGLLDARKLRMAALIGESVFSKSFFLTILVLAIPYLYAVVKLQKFDPGILQERGQEILDWPNPCKPDRAAVDALEQSLNSEVEIVRASLKRDTARQLDATVGALFDDVEHGVDEYLDWYFTIIGEYERLMALATGDIGQMMAEELQRHLFENTRFADRLAAASQAIAEDSVQQMAALSERLDQWANLGVQANPCGLGDLDLSMLGNSGRDGMRASAAAGGATLVAVTSSKLLAKKTTAAFVTKLATKKSFVTASSLLGKAAAKKGGSILISAAGAAALCSPGGPMAVLCGVGAGAVTWLLFDKVFLEIDEALFREEMRADMLAVLTDQKQEIAALLRIQHFGIIDQMSSELQGATKRVFLPARDGW